jgi:hypothetical protein
MYTRLIRGGCNMQDDTVRRPTQSGDLPRERAKSSLRPRLSTEGTVWDVKRWCLGADFSRTWLYEEWALGRGPRRVRIGGKVKILETPREYCERISKEQGASSGSRPVIRSVPK